MCDRVIKFSNGFSMVISSSAGYYQVTMIDNNKPKTWVEGHSYKFNSDMVYRKSLVEEKYVEP